MIDGAIMLKASQAAEESLAGSLPEDTKAEMLLIVIEQLPGGECRVHSSGTMSPETACQVLPTTLRGFDAERRAASVPHPAGQGVRGKPS